MLCVQKVASVQGSIPLNKYCYVGTPPPGELGNNTFGYVGEMIGLCILGETIGYIM